MGEPGSAAGAGAANGVYGSRRKPDIEPGSAAGAGAADGVYGSRRKLDICGRAGECCRGWGR